MELEFTAPVEILETWGYRNRVEGNVIHYTLPALHMGDYETILVSYRLLPGGNPGEVPLARFALKGRSILGVITSYSIHYTKLYEISENGSAWN